MKIWNSSALSSYFLLWLGEEMWGDEDSTSKQTETEGNINEYGRFAVSGECIAYIPWFPKYDIIFVILIHCKIGLKRYIRSYSTNYRGVGSWGMESC